MRCLYRMYDADRKLLYIGATSNGLARFDGHRYGTPWFREVATITTEHLDCTKAEMLQLERAAIAAESPKYNRYRFPVAS